MNSIKSLFIRFAVITCISFFSIGVSAQSGFTSTISFTTTNKTCFEGSLSSDYVVTVSGPAGYSYPSDYTILSSNISVVLRDAYSGSSGTILLTNTGFTVGSSSPTLSGSFDLSGIGSGVYTVYASFVVSDNVQGISVPMTLSGTFTSGYKVDWGDMVDHERYPTDNSCRRYQLTSGVTYGESQSLNYLKAGADGWLEFGAFFRPISGTRPVTILLSDYLRTEVFAASSSSSYLEYRIYGTVTSTSGEGIYVKLGGVRYKLQNIGISDRIRIDRRSNVIRFYKGNSTTALDVANTTTGTITSNFSFPFSGELYAFCYTFWNLDGFSNVLTSFGCASPATVYSSVSPTLTGVNYDAYGKLYFSYDSEYLPSTGNKLDYKIFNYRREIKQSSSVIAGSTQVGATCVYGDNRYELDISSLITGQTYVLELLNEKKELFYLRFTKK
jgi:hypothetical protein